MALFRAEAVVLRTKDLGEADRIVTLLTATEGKLRAVARGARRQRNRLASGTQLFTRADFLLSRGKGLHTVSQCQVLEAFRPLREDLDRLARGSYCLELLDLATEEQDPAPILYPLLLGTLHVLADGPADEWDIALRFFELHLLQAAGFGPGWDVCGHCGGDLPGDSFAFDPAAGGLLCGSCRVASGGLRISLGAVQTARHLLRADLRRARSTRMGAAVAMELERSLRTYITYILERRLRSLDFLDSLRGAENDREVTYNGISGED
ncbi:MAG TPA: DNA repair protein RecO [Firmicutes bacterium]|nr:DNA repair protein RecO [Bacillota bacterium]